MHKANQVIASPTTRATFSNLPPSALTVTAAAYPDHDGNAQPAQATGTQIVTAVADDTFDLSLTLASTIDHLLLTQSAPSVAVGQTTPSPSPPRTPQATSS